MCSRQSNVTAFNKQQRKKSRTEVTWYKWADETEYPVSMAAKSGTWVPGRCFCLPAGRQRALFWVRTNRRIIIYARSCGLSATKSVYFAFFNTCAWLSHFEQGKEKKTLWILIFFFLCCFCKFWLWSRGWGHTEAHGEFLCLQNIVPVLIWWAFETLC